MSAVAFELPVMPLGPMLREQERQIKDKSYRRSPVGQEVGRWLRALRWADLSPNTINSYEATLAKLATRHDDMEQLEDFCTPLGTEYLRDFLDYHWGDCAPATRKQRLAAGDEISRETGNIVLAQQLLRHKSLEHTRRYLHPSEDDLRAGMRVVEKAWEKD